MSVLARVYFWRNTSPRHLSIDFHHEATLVAEGSAFVFVAEQHLLAVGVGVPAHAVPNSLTGLVCTHTVARSAVGIDPPNRHTRFHLQPLAKTTR